MSDTEKSSQPGRGDGKNSNGRTSPLDEVSYSNGRVHRLSRVERMVICLYTSGCSTKEIATKIGITENTVRSHKRTIRHKLNIRDFKKYCWKYRDEINEDLKKLFNPVTNRPSDNGRSVSARNG